MSLKYLSEHAQDAILALALARKEAEHLRYSQSTLFALSIDLSWVQTLGNHPEVAEKVEAFISRFGRRWRNDLHRQPNQICPAYYRGR